MDAVTFSAVSKTLDLLSLRQDYTAQNLANANTPNYQPVRISFADALSVAMTEGASAVEQVEPTIERIVSESGVRIDLELAESSKTAMQYAALTEILGRHMAIAKSAVSGGR
ncbi:MULTISPECIES: flagellar basal body protein [Ponticaulis]|uniref:flagellar basal body rod protein FlgB n=1 Tax=Ponticaulis TaxID=1123044 RepID=UPI0003B6C8AB|nr:MULTISPECIES: flagellar basal body protein [Ponticaulis]MAJ07475.1 flagellar basal body protein [Ponticaulis sp.]RPG17707.1 MAG: flagellar basal body protein [Hyphomonadaceae bacterium TMED125]HBH91046.1 flagellar basal body protein [Hyphomonadaceae bacterium]HBJ93899.1 flagellar basal body protein [Hyphomonadaceae bacterium]|tara:strand:- start:20988 stop:21323 length:336 start_codon:yes stop_codon:yes gene_type:complete